MCPFTSLPAGEAPARFSPTSIKDWAPRRKSVSNACERCRRRKIRCDGDTPCATCSRFSLQCVRTQKSKEIVASEHQAALESRIHQLEAQLASHINTPMHGMDSVMTGSSTFDWQSPPPQLSVNTDLSGFSTPYSAVNELDLGSFSAGGGIPSIAITECELAPTLVSSPNSMWSGTTRTSSPDRLPTSAPQLPPNIVLPNSNKTFSPPLIPHTAPSWEFMAHAQEDTITSHLKPQSSQAADVSRRSSLSSSSIDSEALSTSPAPEHESDVDILPLAPAPRLPRVGVFAANTESSPPGKVHTSFSDRSRAIATTPFPSRFEAETLTSEFVAFLESIEEPKPYSISPSIFSRFCNTVYPDPTSRAASIGTSVSIPMVRFHVFLAMAIGMKVRIRNSAEATNSLLNLCYELAMQQASTSTFWQENGSIEAAQLLSIFASIRKEPAFEPKPLQQSFSW